MAFQPLNGSTTLDDLMDHGTVQELYAAICSLAGALSAEHPNRVHMMGPLTPPKIIRAQPYNCALVIRIP